MMEKNIQTNLLMSPNFYILYFFPFFFSFFKDPARVVYSPTIQYLPYGLSGVVRCFIQASPPFQLVTWTKDRRPFDPNSTPGVMTLNNGSLQFGRVSHEHQGIYRCTPYNIHGSAEPSQGMEVLVRGKLS